MCCSAMTIAEWFILKNNAEKEEHESEEFGVYEGLTHLKLQKLLYYAQGIHLALLNGKPLFNEKIIAWKHGPVVESVYNEFKKFGSNVLKIEVTDEVEKNIKEIDNQTNKILDMAYDNFAIYTAWQLRNMTHEDNSPWDITVKKHGFNKEIPLLLIEKYFKEYVVEIE